MGLSPYHCQRDKQGGQPLCGRPQLRRLAYRLSAASPDRPNTTIELGLEGGLRKMRTSIRHAFAIGSILYGAAFPLRAADAPPEPPHCRYVNLKAMPVTFAHERLIIDAAINDQPIKMFVDTGATHTVLTQHGAERLALPLSHARALGGLGGESRGYQTRVDKLSIGPIEGKRVTLPVFWDGILEKDLDGLVGADFLFQHDLDLSLSDQLLRFMHPLDCKETTNLAYWNHDAYVVDMQEVLPGTDAFPIGDPGREVIVMINGQKIRAKIDTGAPRSMISLAAAKRAGITPDSPGVEKLKGKGSGIGSQTRDIWRATFDSVALGDETIPHAKINISDIWGALEADEPRKEASTLPDMLLGVDFLKKHHVLFAVSQRKFYFSYLGGGLFDSEPIKDQADAK